MEEKIYKSGCEILRGVSLELRNKLMTNLIRSDTLHYLRPRGTEIKSKDYLTLRHMICGGFDWHQSPEGFRYWYDYANNLKAKGDEG